MLEGYNGYSNYATWCVTLHIENEYNIYKYYSELLNSLCAEGADEQSIIAELAAEIENNLESECEQISEMIEESAIYNTVWPDLLNECLNTINFREVAQAFTGY